MHWETMSRRGDHGSHEEDEHDGNAPGAFFHDLGVGDAHLGEDDGDPKGISNTQPKMMNMVRQRLT